MRKLAQLLLFAKLTGIWFVTSGCEPIAAKSAAPAAPSAAAVKAYEAEFAAQVAADKATHEKLDRLEQSLAGAEQVEKLDIKVDTLSSGLESINAKLADLDRLLNPANEPPEAVNETPKPPEVGAAPDVVSQPSSTPARSEQDASSVRPVTIDGQVFELEAFIEKWRKPNRRYHTPAPKSAEETPTEAMVAHLVELGVTEADMAAFSYDLLDQFHNALHEWQKSLPEVAAEKQSGPTSRKAFNKSFVQQWYRGGPYWTHPGSITSHLQGTHNISPDVLAGMTNAEKEAFHSALHEQEAAVKSRTVTKQYATRQYAAPSAGCPSGNCPLPQARYGVFGRRAARRW